MRFWLFAGVVAGCGQVLTSSDLPEQSPSRDGGAEGTAEDAALFDASVTDECTRRLPCGGSDVDADLPSVPTRLCLEACMRVAWDAAGFGDASTDYVKLVDVGVIGDSERAGGFNVGLAQMPYVFADGIGDVAVMQWASGLPRDRWVHVRIEVRYAASPSMDVYVDGELAAESAAPAFRVTPKRVVLTRGPIASGVHPDVDVTFGLVRLTRY